MIDLKKYEYYRNDLGVLYNCDCLDILPHLEPVDLVLTDPPYGVNKAEWDSRYYKAWFFAAKEKSKSVVIITGSCGVKDTIDLVGNDFKDIISGRNLNGMTRGPLGFGNWIAAVYTGEKIKPHINNAFDFCVRNKEKINHPTPKPIEYMLTLINKISLDNTTILDPFLGSGTTAVACERLKRKWIGIEISEEYCKIAVKRIDHERKQLKLF